MALVIRAWSGSRLPCSFSTGSTMDTASLVPSAPFNRPVSRSLPGGSSCRGPVRREPVHLGVLDLVHHHVPVRRESRSVERLRVEHPVAQDDDRDAVMLDVPV